MTRLREVLTTSYRPRENNIPEKKKYSSMRTRILDELKERASHGSIILQPGEGRQARESVLYTSQAYNEAREKLLKHELATNYRVWVSGSARINSGSLEYAFTTDLADTLVGKVGVDIINGAGPGIMAAAALGAKNARRDSTVNSRTMGISIKLPYEEEADPNLDSFQEHQEYTTRIQEMVDMSHAAYFGPGGIGTALELAMVMQLKQSHHLEPDYPIIVHPFWRKTVEDFHTIMYEERINNGLDPLIKKEDLQVTYSDNINDIVGIIGESYNSWQESIGKHVTYRRKPWIKLKK